MTLSSADGSTWYTVLSSTRINEQTWYHLVTTFDSASIKVYLNGVLDATSYFQGTFAKPNINAHIGCEARSGNIVGSFFRGKIDELKVYNYALSADSVAAHYSVANIVPKLIPCSPNPTNNLRPRFLWHLNDSIALYRIQISQTASFNSPYISIPTTDTEYVPTVNLPKDTLFWRVGNENAPSPWSAISSVIIIDTMIPLLIPYVPDPTIEKRPIFTWHPVHGGAPYTIQVSDYADFHNPFLIVPVNDTFFAPTTNLAISTVYWRVKSASSVYSFPDAFTILNDSVPLIINMPDTVFENQPRFKWHKSSGASYYRIQVDSIGSFSSPIAIIVPISDTFYVPGNPLPYGKIYWRVCSDVNLNRYSGPDTFVIARPTHSNSALSLGQSVEKINIGKTHDGAITVSFNVPQRCFVQLDLYRFSGEHVITLFQDPQALGSYRLLIPSIKSGLNAVSSNRYLLVSQFGIARFSRVVTLSRGSVTW
jgi:hypothetical protein